MYSYGIYLYMNKHDFRMHTQILASRRCNKSENKLWPVILSIKLFQLILLYLLLYSLSDPEFRLVTEYNRLLNKELHVSLTKDKLESAKPVH